MEISQAYADFIRRFFKSRIKNETRDGKRSVTIHLREKYLDGFSFPIKLYLSKGIPVKYTTGNEENKETFTRINE